jgi:hypothetical protein
VSTTGKTTAFALQVRISKIFFEISVLVALPQEVDIAIAKKCQKLDSVYIH